MRRCCETMKSPYFVKVDCSKTKQEPAPKGSSGGKKRGRRASANSKNHVASSVPITKVKSAYHTVKPVVHSSSSKRKGNTKDDAQVQNFNSNSQETVAVKQYAPSRPKTNRGPQSLRASRAVQASATVKSDEARLQDNRVKLVKRHSSKLHQIISQKKKRESLIKKPVPEEPGSAQKQGGKKTELTPMKQRELEALHRVIYELRKELNERSSTLGVQKTELQRLEDEVVYVSRMKDEFQDTANLATSAEQEFAEKKQHVTEMKEQIKENTIFARTLEFMRDRCRRRCGHISEQRDITRAQLEQTEKECGTLQMRLSHISSLRASSMKQAQKRTNRLEKSLSTWKDKCNTLKQQVQETKDILKLRATQEKRRMAIIAEVKGDLDADGEGKLKLKVMTNKVKQAAIATEISRNADIIGEFEEAFASIGRQTGITDLNEVVGKVLSQEDTRENLRAMIEQGQQRVSELSAEKQELSSEVSHIRYSGMGSLSKHRKRQDEVEARVEHELRKGEEVSAHHMALRRTVDCIKVAMANVLRQLEDLFARDPSLVAAPLDSSQVGAELLGDQRRPSVTSQDQTGTSLAHTIASCEQRLLRVLGQLEAKDSPATAYLTTPIQVRTERANVMVPATRRRPTDSIASPLAPAAPAGEAAATAGEFLMEELNLRAVQREIPEELSSGPEAEEEEALDTGRSPGLFPDGRVPAPMQRTPLIAGEEGRSRLKEESMRLMGYVEKKRYQLEEKYREGRLSGQEVEGIVREKVMTKARRQSYLRGRKFTAESLMSLGAAGPSAQFDSDSEGSAAPGSPAAKYSSEKSISTVQTNDEVSHLHRSAKVLKVLKAT